MSSPTAKHDRARNSFLATSPVRLWVSQTGIVCLLLAIVAGSTTALGETVVIDPPQGKLQGNTSLTDSSIAVFKSIPYALPPLGLRRFRHAETAADWQGTRLASDFSPACLQPAYPRKSFYARAATPTSEDCLYLNVWTPRSALAGSTATDSKAAQPKGLPVMVWIHGGGLTRGSGSISTYDGTRLAAKGVVLVTINYRLGAFGYMAHPEASAESSFGVSGNYGTSDQIAALVWVQRNIAAFGGDADNVTIFGESAGSWSVHHMLATPRAKGLFHKAIGQSGARFGRMAALRGDASSGHAQGVKLQVVLGAENLAELRSLDGATLLAASQQMRFNEVLDGVIFPEQLYEMFAGHRYNVVPLMVGYNADEGTTLGGLDSYPKSSKDYIASLEKRFGSFSEQLLKHYPADDPKSSSLSLMRDSLFGHGMHTWARLNAQKEKDTYFYYFTHEPLGQPLGAFHAAEIAYAFDNVPAQVSEQAIAAEEPAEDTVDVDQRLSTLMSDYWVAFAYKGKPEVEDAPRWPRYSAKKPLHIEFSTAGATRGRDSLSKRFSTLEKLSASQR